MALMKCPKCMSAIDAADLNMAQGVALCRVCGDLKTLSEVMSVPVLDPVDSSQPPPGCRVEDTGVGVRFEASCRSVGTAVFFGLFSTFWNSITWTILLMGVTGAINQPVQPSPQEAPAASESAGSHPGLVFMFLFMIPFVLIGIGTAAGAFLALFGKVVVSIEGNAGTVRTGVGVLAWTRRFDAGTVKAVTYGQTSYVVNHQHRPLIVIESDKTLKFGSGLSDRRRKWLAAMLHERLVRA